MAPEIHNMGNLERTTAFLKKPIHAKWPALFKRHMGVLESHIKTLDRLMKSMKSEAGTMEPSDRLDWELGERGNWRVICRMMDTARELLVQAREAANGILPGSKLRDKKGLGLIGTTFVRLEPQLQAKAQALGYDPRGKGSLGRPYSEAENQNDIEPVSETEDLKASSEISSDVGSDLKPEVNHFSQEGKEKNRKGSLGKQRQKVHSGKALSTSESEGSNGESEVDFTALQSELQAEIAAREQHVQEEARNTVCESQSGTKAAKKRRRSSDGVVRVVEKKIKKEIVEKKRKRKADSGEVDRAGNVSVKKPKKNKSKSSG